jgi:hypothetical protein
MTTGGVQNAPRPLKRKAACRHRLFLDELVSSMTIVQLRKALEPLGWRFDGANLVSPSQGYWISESDLTSPIRAYLPVARRREMARRARLASDEEYSDLLLALEGEPSVAIMTSRVREIERVVGLWAAAHGAIVSRWDFSLPMVRTSARHPLGGIAYLDCLLGESAMVSVAACHSFDDYSSLIRRSWWQSLHPSELLVDPLRARLDEGLRLLLEPRNPASYEKTHLNAAAGGARVAHDRENELGVLH